MGGEAALDEFQVERLITAVNFVADERMPDVGEVDADLMLAPGAGPDFQQAERARLALKDTKELHLGHGGCAVRTNTILDRDDAGGVFAEGRVDGDLGLAEVPVNDREVALQ